MSSVFILTCRWYVVTIFSGILLKLQEVCRSQFAKQTMLDSLIVYNQSHISDIVSCVSDPRKLNQFTIAPGIYEDDVIFSRANRDICRLAASRNLKGLRSLTLTLDSEHDHDLLIDFLHTLPLLEDLRLTNAPSTVGEIAAIQHFILAAPNLLSVTLKYDSDTDVTHLVDLFTMLALVGTTLTKIDICISDEEQQMPELPKELIDLILEKNSCATRLSFTSFHGNPLMCEHYNSILSRNRSLREFEFCNHQINPNGTLACLVTREEYQWKQVNSEAADILLCSRILASFRHSKSTRLPIEIISSIFTYSMAQSPLWIKEKLDVIVRCLRDRRTIGMIRSEAVRFDKNVLFVKCKRALARVG